MGQHDDPAWAVTGQHFNLAWATGQHGDPAWAATSQHSDRAWAVAGQHGDLSLGWNRWVNRATQLRPAAARGERTPAQPQPAVAEDRGGGVATLA